MKELKNINSVTISEKIMAIFFYIWLQPVVCILFLINCYIKRGVTSFIVAMAIYLVVFIGIVLYKWSKKSAFLGFHQKNALKDSNAYGFWTGVLCFIPFVIVFFAGHLGYRGYFCNLANLCKTSLFIIILLDIIFLIKNIVPAIRGTICEQQKLS